MREREQYDQAIMAAEAMHHLWNLEYEQGGVDIDAKMRRLKDLSAYSLTHAEITSQREVVELYALGMFFGMSSNPQFQGNQERLKLLSKETLTYEGQAEVVEEEIRQRKAIKSDQDADNEDESPQLRLL